MEDFIEFKMYYTYLHAVVEFYGKTIGLHDKYNAIPEWFTVDYMLENIFA